VNKKVFYKISYGLYVVSSKNGGKMNAQIANSVFQASAEPPLIAVCLNKENLTHSFIKESGVFAVSILAKDTPLKFIGHFGFKSGRDTDKFKEAEYKTGLTGAPLITQNCLGYLECEVAGSMDACTHTIFTGKVAEAEEIKDGEPMTYAYYHNVKNGVSPKTSPASTEVKDAPSKTEGNMKKYKCKVCSYVYDPAKGDDDAGIKPGTAFEDLPYDWVCPVCGVGKDEFEETA